MYGETTIGTYLGWAEPTSGGTIPTEFDIIGPIYDYSDLFSDPEQIDNTTMSDKVMTNLVGLSKQPLTTFNMPFDAKIMHKVQAAAGVKKAICLLFEGNGGDAGSSLLWWEGSFAVGMGGGSVNARREMSVIASSATEKKFDGPGTDDNWAPTAWKVSTDGTKIQKSTVSGGT